MIGSKGLTNNRLINLLVLFGGVLLCVGILVWVYSTTTPQTIEYRDSKYGFAMKLPANVQDSIDRRPIDTSVYQTNGALSQFLPEGFAFTGPDTSPYFEINPMNLLGGESAQEFIEDQIKQHSTATAERVNETFDGISWARICSTEQDPDRCNAYTALSAKAVLILSFDSQGNPGANAKLYTILVTAIKTATISKP